MTRNDALLITILFLLEIRTATTKNLSFDCSRLQFWETKVARNRCGTNSSVYHCAYAIHEKRYRYICREKAILIHIGNRSTIQGGLHYEECPIERYQPFHVTSNKTVDCWYLKSLCSEEGQVVYNGSSPDTDTTCRCDYTKGYDFVLSPDSRSNHCYCNPSIEDCSCYKKKCKNSTEILNLDYNCVHEYAPSDDENSTQCKPIFEKDAHLPSSTVLPPIIERQDATDSRIIVVITILVISLLYVTLNLVIVLASPLIVTFVKKDNSSDNSYPASFTAEVKGLSFGQKIEWYAEIIRGKQKIVLIKYEETTGEYFVTCLKPQCICTQESYERVVCNRTDSTFQHQLLPNSTVDKKKKNNSRTLEMMEKFKKDSEFYLTTTINEACEKLENLNFVVLLGAALCGKSWASLHIALQFKSRGFEVYRFTKYDEDTLNDFIESNEKEVYILDFNVDSNSNCTRDKLFETMKELNETKKIILTMKTTGNDKWCQKLPRKHQIRIDSFTIEDKRGILENHMKTNNIEKCDTYAEATLANKNRMDTNSKEQTVKIYKGVIDKIIKAETVESFPDHCQLFCSNPSLLHLEDRYFNNPSKTLVNTISSLRKNKETMLKYLTLVYILRQNHVDHNVDMATVGEVCEELSMSSEGLKQYQIKDAAVSFEDEYLIEKNGLYVFYSEIIKRAVWKSYIDINESFCVKSCRWSYIEDLLRPVPWTGDDVCIGVKWSQLEERLISKIIQEKDPFPVGMYISKLVEKNKDFVVEFINKVKATENLKEKGHDHLIISFLNGITHYGRSNAAIKECSEIVDLIQLPKLGNGNCFLHYAVLYNFEFLSSSDLCSRLKGIFTVRNRNGFSAFEIAVSCGRHDIVKIHEENLPCEYDYYKKLNKSLYSRGKHTRPNVEEKHLKQFGIPFHSEFSTVVQYGSKQDFTRITDTLKRFKSKTSVMLRIKRLPDHISSEQIKNALGYSVIEIYEEKYRFKGKLMDADTGVVVAVCKFDNSVIPTSLMLSDHTCSIDLKPMIKIKILDVLNFIPLIQSKIEDAMSTLNLTVKEIYPKDKDTKELKGKCFDLVVICNVLMNEPCLLNTEYDLKTDDTLPAASGKEMTTENVSFVSLGDSNFQIEKYTMIRLENPPKNICLEDIKKALSDRNISVTDIYREKRRNQGRLSNIRTGDRIATCKPFNTDIPKIISIDNYDAEIVRYEQ